MNNFFNVDNGFFNALGKACDVLFLSVIWAIVCIPIITIGPATTALYYATVKVIRRERGYVFREFFKSFRMNFMRGAIIGLTLTIILIILSLDIFTAWTSISNNSSLNSVFLGIYLAITLFMLGFSIYVFPVLSRFNMTIKQLVKAASIMTIKHLFHTISMLFMLIATIAALIFVPILIFVVPAVTSLLISIVMEDVLKKYMPKSENDGENENKDEWYLE